MNILIKPSFDNDGPAQKLEFQKLIQHVTKAGWIVLLLHFTDGSVMLRLMTDEERRFWSDKEEAKK